MSEHYTWIPIQRSLEHEGKKYVYGYAAIFTSPDAFGTVMSRDVVEDSLPHLMKFPACRFMHREPFAQIVFDREVKGVKTFIDQHGFHVLCEVYESKQTEWEMVQHGGWGFSFGFMPDPNTSGFEMRQTPDGQTLPHFAHGKIYEVSIVDVPAHAEAVAQTITRSLSLVQSQEIKRIPRGLREMLDSAFPPKLDLRPQPQKRLVKRGFLTFVEDGDDEE
jgi:phage head maturation protease